MPIIRHLLARHRALSALLLAFALLMKAAIPNVVMIGNDHGRVAIEICNGYGPMAMAMPGMAHHHHDTSDHQCEMHCALSGLHAAAIAAAPPVLLAIAIAFILALSFKHAAQPLTRPAPFLRPPLRGPPLPA